MIIAGLQKLSLVDFPGYLSAVVFTQGCNFKCGFCHNPDLIAGEAGISNFSQQEILDFLLKRKTMIEGVVFTGGEPTLQSDLSEFLKHIKDLDLKIKLDTNGSHPEIIKNLLKTKAIDYIALDIKTSFLKYPVLSACSNITENISASIEYIMSSGIQYEFRTTCVPGLVAEDDVIQISEVIKGAKKYCLQQFRPMITYDKTFQELKPYQKDKLYRFRDIIKEYVQEVEIRGI
ncbi:MAG: anaerobic ribonucleoside-triphosphate reductase activating protein [Candidatus Omnitrophota bacterium]